jgi:hypothetical protein
MRKWTNQPFEGFVRSDISIQYITYLLFTKLIYKSKQKKFIFQFL